MRYDLSGYDRNPPLCFPLAAKVVNCSRPLIYYNKVTVLESLKSKEAAAEQW